MGTVFFAAVDENLNLPPEVRTQLAKSPELRATIVPMTQATRDNLRSQERWNGRTVYNINTKSIEVWHASLLRWVRYFDDETTAPTPTKPWDAQYNLPSVVRSQMAKSAELKDLVVPMTTILRDALEPSEIWDGRTIYNTTTKALETWSVTDQTWHVQYDANYIPPGPEEIFESLFLEADDFSFSSGQRPVWLSGYMRYTVRNKKVVCSFSFDPYLLREIDPDPVGAELRMNLPVPGKVTGLTNIGTARLATYAGEHVRNCRVIKLSGEDFVQFEYSDFTDVIGQGRALRVLDNAPFTWTSYSPAIIGQIIYEAA